MTWEVFDPKTCETYYRVPFKWIAKLICRFRKELDYAPEGWGYID
jgi:hypothetical protein